MKEQAKIYYHSAIIKTCNEEIDKLTLEFNNKVTELTELRNTETEKLFSNHFESF